MADILELTDRTINEYLLQEAKPVIVIFMQTGSTPCALYEPRYARVAALLGEKAVVGLVEIDDNMETVRRFSVFAIPTTLIFWKGVVIRQYIGIQESDTLTEVVTEALAGTYDSFIAENKAQVPAETPTTQEKAPETETTDEKLIPMVSTTPVSTTSE